MANSPDGSTCTPGNGPALSLDSVAVTNADGTWKFAPVAPGATTAPLLRDGAGVSGFIGSLIVISAGQMFVRGLNAWWVWKNGGFAQASDPRSPPTISLPASTVPVGSDVTISVANGPGNRLDWVTIAQAASAATAYLAWVYLNSGTQTGGATGVKSGTVKLRAPATAGPYEVRFLLNNQYTVAARAPLTVTAVVVPTIQIAVTPSSPTIPDTTPKGAVVATYAITMSDGSPFTGVVRFAPPNGDSGGIFALVSLSSSTGQIIVNPTGPGVGPNMTTVTDHITIEAV